MHCFIIIALLIKHYLRFYDYIQQSGCNTNLSWTKRLDDSVGDGSSLTPSSPRRATKSEDNSARKMSIPRIFSVGEEFP